MGIKTAIRERNRFQLVAWVILTLLAVTTVVLTLLQGRMPSVSNAKLGTVLFVALSLSPYYILFRMDQRKDNTNVQHAVYLAGVVVIGGYGLVTRAYCYSVSLVISQLLMCAMLRLGVFLSQGRQRLILTLLAIPAVACSLALNCLLASYFHLPNAYDYYGPDMPEDVRAQLRYFYWIWSDPERTKATHEEMRQQNPEWDMISRTFFAYSLANVALKYPSEREGALSYLDTVIDSTVKVPWRDFLLPYGQQVPFVRQPASSVMVDSEVSLMIGLRRLVKDPPGYKHRDFHKKLVNRCVEAMEAGPVLCGEGYPNECWLWCNPLALTSIKVFDILEGTDHSDLIRRWGKMARERLIDKDTGLINSAVTLKGRVIHPPEGSTIWIGAYCLEPVLPDLAREQYEQMKKLLSGRLFFLRYGREWPKGTAGAWDIDSGFTPFGMAPASTGFALVASKEMNDRDFFVRILAFLNLVGVPRQEDGRLRYLSSNLVGDAIFLLGKTTGPAWEEIERRGRSKGSGK